MTALCACPSAWILHTHCPKELKGNRENKKGEVFYSSCCCQKLSCEPTRRTRGHRRAGCSMLHVFWFWLSSIEMPPAHSNNQTCLSGLKLLSKGTTKHCFWLKPLKNSLKGELDLNIILPKIWLLHQNKYSQGDLFFWAALQSLWTRELFQYTMSVYEIYNNLGEFWKGLEDSEEYLQLFFKRAHMLSH